MWNVDETWLNTEDHTHYAWGEAGKRLSVPCKKSLLRISMVLAFNNHGNVYYAISDQNTTSETFSLFMRHLCQTLDAE